MQIQLAAPCFLQLPYHLASNSFAPPPSLSLCLSFSFSFFSLLFLSLSLCVSGCLWLSVAFVANVPWPSHRTISITLERNWKRQMKGKWRKMKENAYKWMRNERNMKCCRSTWNQQNNSSISDPFPNLFRNGDNFRLDFDHFTANNVFSTILKNAVFNFQRFEKYVNAMKSCAQQFWKNMLRGGKLPGWLQCPKNVTCHEWKTEVS